MSVSTADEDTHSSAVTGPVTSTSFASTVVEYTRTSLLGSAVVWSTGPGFSKSPRQQSGPPIVGKGFAGSYSNVSLVCACVKLAAGASVLSAPSPANEFAFPPEYRKYFVAF